MENNNKRVNFEFNFVMGVLVKMCKIVYVVLQNFNNDSRVLKQCISLKKHGYKVQVIALHEEGLRREEIIGGVPVCRIHLKTKEWPRNIFVQAIKYIEFFIKVLLKIRDVNIVNASSLGPLPIAVALKFLSLGRIKIVYDARELETETTGLKGVRKVLAKLTERACIRFVDGLTTVSESIVKDYEERYNNMKKPVLIMNTPPVQNLTRTNIFRETFGIDQEKKIFLYQGGLMPGRGLEILIEAFLKMERKDVVLVVMGYGPLKDLLKKKAVRSGNIFFHDAVSPLELLSYTSSADVGIALIENTCLSYYYCLPNKLFEYAMAGLPVLVSDLYELSKIVSTYNCGEIVKGMSTSSVLEGIDRILERDINELGQNARRMAEIYSWEKQEVRLLKLYNELLNQGG